MKAAYDRIGRGYSAFRATDPSIAAAIRVALAGADSVLNVGAGSGCYEGCAPRCLAVEPSATMMAQRSPGSAPVVQAVAERLPFRSRSFEAAMALFTVHHWDDLFAGLIELKRVAGRLVLLTFDADVHDASGCWPSTSRRRR